MTVLRRRYPSPMTPGPLPELDELLRIVEAGGAHLDVRIACEVADGAARFPVHAIGLGNPAADAPAIGFFGGVHGLERIGTQVVLSLLGSLIARLHWDEVLHRQLADVRLVFMPLVNPAGMRRRRRANANGVDLMRNAPVESSAAAFLVGGQRWSARLPWYRGGQALEAESAALCRVVREELLSRPFSMALDCHSGFGMRDRIWFPHAHTRDPFRHLADVHALMEHFEESYPHHEYLFEPQSRQYLTHGDLWDYLSVESARLDRTFIPLTLEMGSWRWIAKSPRQILSRLGVFNPLPADRLLRVRRNHLIWMGFLCRAAQMRALWIPSGEARARHERSALASWFGRTA